MVRTKKRRASMTNFNKFTKHPLNIWKNGYARWVSLNVLNGWFLKIMEKYKYEDLIPCIEFLYKSGVIIDDVKLYDQFSNLISFLKSEKIKFVEDYRLHEQWRVFFKSCPSIDCFSELLKICEFYFCISAHNTNVERVFPLINAQWTKEQNRLNVETMKAIILTQYNFKDIMCMDFYSYLLRNKELLSKIGSSEKYA